MKLLIDRLRPYVEARRLRGKWAIVVSLSAEGPEACDPLLEMFRRMFLYLKIEFEARFLVKPMIRAK
jgi:hypothetical protein